MQFVKKFQEGGAAPAAPQLGLEDPTAVLMQGATLAVQNLDCQVAMQVCQMVIEMLGGGGAPAEELAAPAEGEPVYRMGGRLSRRIRN